MFKFRKSPKKDYSDEVIEAVKENDLDTLKDLFSKDPAVLDVKDEGGVSLIQLACYYKKKDVLSFLLEQKTTLNIYEAVAIGSMEEVIEIAESNPSKINSFSPDGFTPLALACFFGHLDIVIYLLEKQANPNLHAQNNYRVCPLHSAVASRHFDIAVVLLENGADVNAKQMSGITPLHQAAHNGQKEMVELLLRYKAEVNARMENSQTPLSMALDKGHKEIAEILKQNGAL